MINDPFHVRDRALVELSAAADQAELGLLAAFRAAERFDAALARRLEDLYWQLRHALPLHLHTQAAVAAERLGEAPEIEIDFSDEEGLSPAG